MNELNPSKVITINGVNFTSRELDILACMVSGRRNKTIASLLSIAPKTVETHIHNIMLKLECSSQESIISFIEKSGKLAYVKQHYLSILIRDLFAQCLKEVAKLVHKEALPHVHLVVEEGQVSVKPIVEQLKKHFNAIGLKADVQHKSSSSLFANNGSTEHKKSLYLLTAQSFESLHISNLSNDAFILLVGEGGNVSNNIHSNNLLDFRESRNYDHSFLDLVAKLFPQMNFDQIISSFKKQCEIIQGSGEPVKMHKGSRVYEETQNWRTLTRDLFKRLENQYKAISIAGLGMGIFLVFAIKQIDTGSKVVEQNSGHPQPQSVRSDLPLPTEANLLQRPKIIAEIKKNLRSDKEIQTIALAGIGGAGKTTLARQYAQSQKLSVVWELNAETKEAILHSFEALAYSLAHTEGEKKILTGLQAIKEFNEREEKILLFVRGILKVQPGWLLIYDNVENLSDIQKYFPSDPHAWGQGKLIVTTRNGNIRNNNHMDHVINVDELAADEKLSLFTKIISNEKIDQFKNFQKEQTIEFLKNIPPFPLDVSIAAYYLKSTNMPYDKYLSYLNQQNDDFNTIQENILKEASGYSKTRYNIIKLSLKEVISIHKDFKDLLLCMSFVDSQNIPRDLLSKYKGDSVVSNFIYNLKKYSLITNEAASQDLAKMSFSIHRSTQEKMLSYLLNSFDVKTRNQSIESFADILENFMAQMLNNDDTPRMKSFVRHCEAFLSHHELFPVRVLGALKSQLGGFYYYFGDYITARKLLENSLIILNKYENEKSRRIAWGLAHLGIVNRELSNPEKAKVFLEKSLAVYRQNSSGDDIETARTLRYLGIVYKSLGYYEKAQALFEESLSIFKTCFSEQHPAVAWSLVYLGHINRSLGDYNKAIALIEQGLEIFIVNFSENNIDVAWTMIHLGNTYREIGDYQKAEALIAKGLIISKNNLSNNHVRLAWALEHLGKIYNEEAKYDKAKEVLEHSLKIYKSHFSEDHLRVARAYTYLGDAYAGLQDYDNAKALLNNGLIIYEKSYAKNLLGNVRILMSLGKIYLAEDDFETAESLFNKALSICMKQKHPKAHVSLEKLSDLYIRKHEWAKNNNNIQQAERFKVQAINYLKQALEITEAHFPKESSYTLRVQEKLKNLGVT